MQSSAVLSYLCSHFNEQRVYYNMFVNVCQVKIGVFVKKMALCDSWLVIRGL
jgi:hypothetical protein